MGTVQTSAMDREPFQGFIASRNCRETQSDYRYTLNRFQLWLTKRHTTVCGITKRDLVDFINTLKVRLYAPASLLHTNHVLRSFYGYLVATDQIEKDPTTVFDVIRFRKPPRRPRPLTHAHEDALLDGQRQVTEKDFMARLVVLLGLRAGLRVSEMSTLAWKRIDFDENVFTVHGKGDKERAIPIHPDLRPVLYSWRQRCRTVFGLFPSIYVFRSPNRHADRPPTRATMCRLLAHAKALAGLQGEDFTIHALRHTFATRLAESGANAHEIASLMGHEDISTSQMYVDITQNQAFKAFGRAFGNGSETRQEKKEPLLHCGH